MIKFNEYHQSLIAKGEQRAVILAYIVQLFDLLGERELSKLAMTSRISFSEAVAEIERPGSVDIVNRLRGMVHAS